MAEDKGLEFLFKVDENVPCHLNGDPMRLGQILMNLAGNAIKFTEKGEIVISVSLDGNHETDTDIVPIHMPSSHGTNHITETEFEINKELPSTNRQAILKFSVKDSGVGLHSEQIDSLFDAFSQADDSITRKYGGSGLGLSICSQLTKMMGGSIWVESKPDIGSTFIFTVKLNHSTSTQADHVHDRNLFHEHKALVVDDNKTARELLVSILDSFGMTVDSAPDGKSALQRMDQAFKANKPYSLVLLDWIMPGMDGIETARRIKADNALAGIPAMLMVTANAREEARVAAQKIGINAFLLKPVYPSIMFNTLQEILGLESSPSKSPSTRKIDPKRLMSVPLDNIRGAEILLVEDNAINQEVAKAFLEDVGMVVDIAENGRACLEMIEEKVYDLILMDIQMPVLDGLETTRIIRNKKKFRHLPIIAMTAHAMAGDQEKSLQAGMNGHINKPVNPRTLYQVLQQFIPEKQKNEFSGAQAPTTTASGTSSPVNNRPKVMADQTLAGLSLPPLEGIDPGRALARLNHKPELFLTILNDFKKNYGNYPAYLQDLLEHNNLNKIYECAHTVKGISGYMAADALHDSAADLETHLKNIISTPQEESIIYSQAMDQSQTRILLNRFISEIDVLLYTLKQMPDKKTKDLPDKDSTEDSTSSQPNLCIKKLNEEQIKFFQEFTALLLNGEFTAMSFVPEMEKILCKLGCEEEISNIVGLLDDIEFEKAAQEIISLTGIT